MWCSRFKKRVHLLRNWWIFLVCCSLIFMILSSRCFCIVLESPELDFNLWRAFVRTRLTSVSLSRISVSRNSSTESTVSFVVFSDKIFQKYSNKTFPSYVLFRVQWNFALNQDGNFPLRSPYVKGSLFSWGQIQVHKLGHCLLVRWNLVHAWFRDRVVLIQRQFVEALDQIRCFGRSECKECTGHLFYIDCIHFVVSIIFMRKSMIFKSVNCLSSK